MSLLTDIIFVKALRASQEIIDMLPAGDVYNTSIALPDEDFDNAPVPYVIVSFDSLTNDIDTKDDPYESESDAVNISIEIAARTRQELGELAQLVRHQVHDYFIGYDQTEEDAELIPTDYQFTAQAVIYDQLKPCYLQVLNYQCDTNS